MKVAVGSQTCSVLIARQPIFDACQNVHAYEILFHVPPGRHPDGHQWLLDLLGHTKLSKVANGLPLYLRLPNECFRGEPECQADTSSLVLDLAAPGLDGKILSLLARWKGTGISIAVRNLHMFHDKWERVLEIADLVKIDVMLDENDLESLVSALKPHSVRLMAERVETHGLFLMCKRLGFDYFQGHFFKKPGLMVEHPDLSSDKVKLLNLMGKTLEASSPDELEEEIRRDLALSYKLLAFVNSAYFGLRQKVDSIGHALAMLGLNNIRSWIAMLLMCNLAKHKPPALLTTAISRARFLELLAKHRHEETQAPNYFLLGMFSLLDAMLDMPMEMALEPLSLPSLVKEGITQTNSNPGMHLQLMNALEAGNWNDVESLSSALGFSEGWHHLYQQALHWADQYMTLFHGRQP